VATYRYLLTDVLNASVRLAELPFESATYSHVLNAPGAFSGTMGLQQPAKLAAVLTEQLQLGQVSLWVERDGVIVWGGILWTSDADIDAGTITYAGEGWHSYFRRRTLRARKVYLAQDQTTQIAKNLIDYAQSFLGGSIGVDTSGVAATGVLRDRTYEAFERKNIGEAVDQLATVENGFDFRYDSIYDNGNLSVRFLTSYPPTGRHTEIVLEVGKQLAALGIKTDATSLATNVDAIGAGEGDIKLLATVSDPGLLGIYPMLDDVVSFTDVSEQATLTGHARKRLAQGASPVVIPNVEWDPSLEPVIGSFLAGDIVTVRGGMGIAQLDGPFRITTIEVTVDDAGGETGKLSFAGLESFSD
jgi:hypothetical protein